MQKENNGILTTKEPYHNLSHSCYFSVLTAYDENYDIVENRKIG